MFINKILKKKVGLKSNVVRKKPFTKKYKRLINDNIDPHKLNIYDVNLNNQLLDDKIQQSNCCNLFCLTLMIIFYYCSIISRKIFLTKKN